MTQARGRLVRLGIYNWNENLKSDQILTSNVTWADPERQLACSAWLAVLAQTHGLVPSSLRIASADASFRRYLRVDTQTGASLIVMDAPPDKENCEPFVKVAKLMKLAGLKAPEVLAWQEAQGFMLLTDLGDQTMMSAIDAKNPQANHALYMQAVDALITWQLSSQAIAEPRVELVSRLVPCAASPTRCSRQDEKHAGQHFQDAGNPQSGWPFCVRSPRLHAPQFDDAHRR